MKRPIEVLEAALNGDPTVVIKPWAPPNPMSLEGEAERVRLFQTNVAGADPIPLDLARLLCLLADMLEKKCAYRVAWPGPEYMVSQLGYRRMVVDRLLYDLSLIGCFHILTISTSDFAKCLMSRYYFDVRMPGPSSLIDVYVPRYEHPLWREPPRADGHPYAALTEWEDFTL